MSEKQTLSWEPIDGWPRPGYRDGRKAELYRAAVPGGWLVGYEITEAWDAGGVGAGGLTFVPDPKHTWKGGSVDRG